MTEEYGLCLSIGVLKEQVFYILLDELILKFVAGVINCLQGTGMP